jgi:hypothetical protein
VRKLGLVLASSMLAGACSQAAAPPPPKKAAAGAVRGSVTAASPASAATSADADGGPIEVKFPPDFNAVTLRGRIVRSEPVTYSVPLKAGDVLSARITESNPNHDVVFSITSPAKRSLMGAEGEDYDTAWEGRLSETGAFTIRVGSIETPDSPFVLELELKNRP